MAICANPDCDSVWFGSGWQIEMPSPPHRYNGYLTSRPYKVYARKKYCTAKCRQKLFNKKWNDYLRERPTDPIELERWLINKEKQRTRLKNLEQKNKLKPKVKKEKVKNEFILEKTKPDSIWVPKAFFIDPKYRDSLGYDFGNKDTSGFYSTEFNRRRPGAGRPKKQK
jgi:hypothetical protein